jgi:transcriptional regulator with XRE-family HTH domain
MVDQDMDELRRLLRETVDCARAQMHTRDIEAALGVGHGNLDRLLNGTLELRVRHLLGFARLLKIPPADLFELGCTKATAAAQNRLLDWLGPDRRRAQGPSRLPSTPEELAELIRSAVREELAAREGGSGDPQPRRR